MEKLILPNVRKVIIPDDGCVMFEADLKGADAQVVAWEAEDDDLKAAFRAGVDIHIHNAEAMWGSEFTKLPEDSYARKHKRQECKHTVHGVNYGCTPRTTAAQRGWTVREAEKFHTRWLSLHPGIRRWHERIKSLLAKNRTITNAFGFRRVFFDRIDNCFTEALAWVPQSTVALNTYAAALQVEAEWFRDPRSVEGMLLQTHDSLNFQFHKSRRDFPTAVEIKGELEVVTPYPDPLIIPWDLKSSEKSWGDMKKVA